MITKEEAKDRISKIIERFDFHIEDYKKGTYNETQTRNDYINPFFEALGWDINNKQGLAESYREVIHEDKVKVAGKTKAPDYCFTIYGQRKFFVEAKKPSVHIKESIEPAYQLRRYGWSAKMPISIITDFEEFSIYDCTIKPAPQDKASVARIKYITFNEYIKEFDFLWNTFSKEMVLKGSFDKFISSNKGKKGTSEVDKEFLKSLDSWRDLLARNIVNRNKEIDEDTLNFSLQKIMDRLIFLRICEDRGIEPENNLFDTIGNNIFEKLKTIFRIAEQKYNSGLFDFNKDLITDKINIDDKVLKTIIEEMYYPKCPYEFSVIPVEILGHSYEQYLGKVIRITPGHILKIETKPEVRKAGGVYYTPQYIVDYIAKNTVGKVVEGKTPEEIASIRICDPACGSGSFLIGAYQFLLDWHKDFYTKQGKQSKGSKDSPLTPLGGLTTSEKKRILLNNIYGVDLDSNAVEVSKLSLLLKCMEGETKETVETQIKLFHDRVLPSLDNNIKSGNSLIDMDFYESQIDFEPGMEKKIKPFNWESAFPKVFGNRESGIGNREAGFDVVIGNPPYGAELDKHSFEYLKKKYPIGNTDTAALFMVLSQNLLKEKGYNGFIIPKSFTYASNWEKTRGILLKDIIQIVDCSKVWREVKFEMSVYIAQKASLKNYFKSFIRKNETFIWISNVEKTLCDEFGFILNGVTEKEIEIGKKIKSNHLTLNDIALNKQGIPNQKYTQSEKSDYMVIGGAELKRYGNISKIKGFISKEYITDDSAFIKENSIFVQRIVAHIANPIPHIKIIASVIENIDISNYIIVNTVIQLHNISNLSKYYILGIINSKLISWYSYKFIFANAIRTMQFYNPTTSRIPIPQLPTPDSRFPTPDSQLTKLVETMLQLNKDLQNAVLPEQKEHLQARISYTDKQIDSLVYQLYNLTDEEIKIVEGG